MIADALAYVDRGYAVFPVHAVTDGVCGCGVDTCTSPGKHPVASLVPRGVKEATDDAVIVRQWWAVYPDANIGVATGSASGVCVLDLDRHGAGADGIEAFKHLATESGMPVPRVPISVTGGGGRHLWFQCAEGVGTARGGLPPGIDVRGEGGYVLAPPSTHISGDVYQWKAGLSMFDIEPKPMPCWLSDLIGQRKVVEQLPEKIITGGRNNWLTSLAGSVRRRGGSIDGIMALLEVENRTRCKPPLSPNELWKIAESVGRYEPEKQEIVVQRVKRPDGTYIVL